MDLKWAASHDEPRWKLWLCSVRLTWKWKRLYTLHCWADGRDEDDNGYTCMRAAGHFGAHEPQPDGEVMMAFR